MAKLYFQKDDLMCYPLVWHREFMSENKLDSLVVYQAKRVENSSFFFCKEYAQVGEKGNCGRGCEKYQPCNKVSGKCIHASAVYENTQTPTLLKAGQGQAQGQGLVQVHNF